jgi:hypothetical protein
LRSGQLQSHENRRIIRNIGWEVTKSGHLRTGGLSETTVEKWPNPVTWEPADYQKQRLSNDKSSHVRTGGHQEQRLRSSLIQSHENRRIIRNNGWEVTKPSHLRTGGLSETTVAKLEACRLSEVGTGGYQAPFLVTAPSPQTVLATGY